jgi:hypothetical protein
MGQATRTPDGEGKVPKPKSAKRRLRVGFALPAPLISEVESYAETHGIRRSEALRYLIEAGLAAEAAAMLENDSTMIEDA